MGGRSMPAPLHVSGLRSQQHTVKGGQRQLQAAEMCCVSRGLWVGALCSGPATPLCCWSAMPRHVRHVQPPANRALAHTSLDAPPADGELLNSTPPLFASCAASR